MCGRYTLTAPPEAIQRTFEVPERPNLPPRYNVAPTQAVPAVRVGDDGARHLVSLRWGLIPSWADDSTIGARLINARAETAASKPAFRAAFARRRCLIPADGFYEWRKPTRPGAAKQPYRIARPDGSLFAFAGLWESWRDPVSGAALESCTILTTEANSALAPIHPRMPVILCDHTAFAAWLAPAATPFESLLAPCPDDALFAHPVSPRVNKVAHDDPALIEALAAREVESPRDPAPQTGRLL